MVSLIVLLKSKGHPLRILLKRTRGLLNKEKFLFGISAFGVFQMILYSLVSGELLVSLLGLCSSQMSFCLSCCVFLFFGLPIVFLRHPIASGFAAETQYAG